MDAPKVQTNGSAVDWGKVSKSKIKDEALLFFQVSPEERLKDKKVFKIRLEDLLKIKKKHDVVELDLIGSDDVDGHIHLVISD